MKVQKINYRIHDSNDKNELCDHILKVFLEANKEKAEKAIKAYTEKIKPKNTQLHWINSYIDDELPQKYCANLLSDVK